MAGQKLILFDCDGTMTDSHGLIVSAMQQAFAESAQQAPTALAVQDVTGLSLALAIEALGATGEMQARIAARYSEYYRAKETDVELFPGVLDTLIALKRRGYWLGVVTGKSKAGVMRVLERLSLTDFFYVIRTADCTHSKPHPAMVLECMAELGVSACNTSVIGDAVFDMQMAVAAGVRVIGVSFGAASGASLAQAGADDIIDHFPELLHHYPDLIKD
ncbi:MAG: HAD-IIIA family hydrolase [Mariprofundus sp.]